MTDDPIADGARAAANRLSTEHGPRLIADVESTLHARYSSARPDQYFDPTAVASLIVAAATLAWTVYRDIRSSTPNPTPDVVTRVVRTKLRETRTLDGATTDHVLAITVEETLNAALDHHPDPTA